MQDNKNTQDKSAIEAALRGHGQSDDHEQEEKSKLKKNGLKEQFKKKGDEQDEQQKAPMSKEDTIKFYEENLPFMRIQDEFDELAYRFEERKIKQLELRVRQTEAVGYLAQWKAQQDESTRKHEQEQKMKEQWDAMTPEQREEFKQQAKANLHIMEMQAKGKILYDGTNAHDIVSFVTGELHPQIIIENKDKKFTFEIPVEGGNVDLSIVPGQTLSRTEAGEFIVSFE